MKTLTRCCLLSALLLLAACATTPSSRQYRLLALAQGGHAGEGDALLRIRSVTVPGVVDRPVIVTWREDMLLHSSEFERWVEPVEAQIAEVLVRNLDALLPGHQVVRGRRHAGLQTDLELEVEILRFDGILGEEAVLELRWSWIGVNAPSGLHEWRGKSPLNAKEPPAFVRAQSELLLQAGKEIANTTPGKIDEG